MVCKIHPNKVVKIQLDYESTSIIRILITWKLTLTLLNKQVQEWTIMEIKEILSLEQSWKLTISKFAERNGSCTLKET